MNYFLIDAGNTHIKIAPYLARDTPFTGRETPCLVVPEALITLSSYVSLVVWITTLIKKNQSVQLYVSWVRSREEWQQFVLDTQATCVQLIDATTLKVSMSAVCQFHSDYDLQQMGVDRWLQMLGAACLYPNQSFILWQAGTAQTIDWVSNDCNSSIIHHQQGWIVLGIATYLKALHDYTGQLPHLELTEVIETLSRNTSDRAITTQAAITTGLTHYLRGLIMQIYQCSPPTSIWLVTGGDRQIIAQMIQHLQQSGYLPITLSLHLIDVPLALYGLAHIAHHHLQHAVV